MELVVEWIFFFIYSFFSLGQGQDLLVALSGSWKLSFLNFCNDMHRFTLSLSLLFFHVLLLLRSMSSLVHSCIFITE